MTVLRTSKAVFGLVFFVLALQAAVGFFTPAFAESLAVIQIRHRPAEEALAAVRLVLSPEGRATADPRANSLLVVDSEAALARVRDMLARFDQPVAQLRIYVRFEEDLGAAGSAVSAQGRISGSGVSIGTPSAREDGLRVDVGAGRAERRREADYSVLVASGSSAFIRTGTQIPYRSRWVDLTRQYARVRESVQFHQIDTGFDVRPTATGEGVLLEIVPRISDPAGSGGQGQILRFTEAATRLSVPFDQWVPIAGAGQEENRALQAVVEAGGSERQERRNIQLMVKKETIDRNGP